MFSKLLDHKGFPYFGTLPPARPFDFSRIGKTAILVVDETETIFLPAFKVITVDTTSGGDVFCRSFADAQIEGKSLTESLCFVSGASAISVPRLGAQSLAPYRNEIDDFLLQNR